MSNRVMSDRPWLSNIFNSRKSSHWKMCLMGDIREVRMPRNGSAGIRLAGYHSFLDFMAEILDRFVTEHEFYHRASPIYGRHDGPVRASVADLYDHGGLHVSTTWQHVGTCHGKMMVGKYSDGVTVVVKSCYFDSRPLIRKYSNLISERNILVSNWQPLCNRQCCSVIVWYKD